MRAAVWWALCSERANLWPQTQYVAARAPPLNSAPGEYVAAGDIDDLHLDLLRLLLLSCVVVWWRKEGAE